MKISTLIEVLVISVLIAFVSCKSVEAMAVESTNTNNGNTSSAEALTRQVMPNEPSIEVVQDLTDSDEILMPDTPLIADDEIPNAVDELLAEKPAAIAADPEPIASIESTQPPVAPIVENNDVSAPINENDPNPINKYCSCSSAQCKCCRDFMLPIIPIRGPGCATIRYLDDDKVAVTIKYGDFVLTSRTINSRRSAPICVPLPGGFNRFCGRIYGISRRDENFKACLGLELRADDEVEASLRVSCFQFGPRGLATIDAEPLPPLENENDGGAADDDDDDDDGDFLGLGELAGGEDEEEEEDDDEDDGDIVSDVLGGDEDEGLGGGLLRGAEDFFGSFFEAETKKKPSSGIIINRKVDKLKKLKGLKKSPTIATSDLSEKLATSVGPAKTKEENVDEYDQEEDQADKHETTKEEQEEKEEDDADDKEEEKEESYEDEEDDESYDEYNEVRENDSSSTATSEKNSKKKKVKSSSYGLGFLGRVLNFFY